MNEISALVERFGRNREAYLSGNYNETQLRREFIDPFFTALGWDVDNKQGYAEAYKDVIHEDAIKIGEHTKAPDYCFRLGGVRKFFVEAKKPSVNLKDDVSPAFQLRRYAWSAKLPLSILTDFEEFAVYDCRNKPAKSDKPAVGRILYLTYQDYETRWEEISRIFSKEAIPQGSFDKYVETNKAKKGTAEVDAAFLEEIESWRDLLARNLALRNAGLSQPELNFSVQRTIDRLIFLRICEDRGIEKYGTLQALLEGERVYQRLTEMFQRADEKYNSGIFHFQKEKDREEAPDGLTLGLKIDDKPLQEIIRNLYYPDSPYEFSVLPADILGQVYEQFLGKVIRLTAGHRAVVEDKPEVKKAGGVYYTPTYIVDYIVKNTVGKLLEGKTPKQTAKLRLLDPACGSGSFLIGAYQYLLDWHRDWYVTDGPEKHATGKQPALFQAAKGDWRLTTTERKRILLNNIFGVDIDPQAVEVTKLSLLLKVLEGENAQTISQQLKFFHERALPDLGNNIKCGNSLIGPDFYEQQMNLLDDAERLRINVFDWQTEFREIMQAGGFDAVIGNPPYVRMELFKELKEYLRNNYESHDERTDLYVYFIERSVKLLSPKSLYGVIVANRWIRSAYGKRLRGFLTRHATLKKLIDFGELPVFEQAATMPVIVILQSSKPLNGYSFSYTAPVSRDVFRQVVSGGTSLAKIETENSLRIASENLSASEWRLGAVKSQYLQNKLQSIGITLDKYTKGQILYGIKTGLVEAFIINEVTRQKLIKQSPKAEKLIKPYVVGDDVRKYHIRDNKRYLIYTHHGVDITGCESIIDHLKKFKSKLQKRATKQEWYELQQPQFRYTSFYKISKIIYPDIAKESRFAFDTNGLYPADTTFVIPVSDPYLLGLLNSRVVFYYLGLVCPVLGDVRRGGRLRLKFNYVKQLPIRSINFSDPADKSRHDRMVALVERMLALHQQLAAAKIAHEQTALQRQIEATDRQIDALVYALYGLTEEEIKIVEGRET